jgi:hypothetical protein
MLHLNGVQFIFGGLAKTFSVIERQKLDSFISENNFSLISKMV